MRSSFTSTRWIALIDHDDALHSQAVATLAAWRHGGRRLVTSDFVLIEVADGFSHPTTRMLAYGFLVLERERARRRPKRPGKKGVASR